MKNENKDSRLLSLASNCNHKQNGNWGKKDSRSRATLSVGVGRARKKKTRKGSNFWGWNPRQHPQCHPIITVWVGLCICVCLGRGLCGGGWAYLSNVCYCFIFLVFLSIFLLFIYVAGFMCVCVSILDTSTGLTGYTYARSYRGKVTAIRAVKYP